LLKEINVYNGTEKYRHYKLEHEFEATAGIAVLKSVNVKGGYGQLENSTFSALGYILDTYTFSYVTPKNEGFKNTGKSVPTPIAGIQFINDTKFAERWVDVGVATIDFDEDGLLDFIEYHKYLHELDGNRKGYRLYRNTIDANGGFTDVSDNTDYAHCVPPAWFGEGEIEFNDIEYFKRDARLIDFNGDGLLDVYFGSYLTNQEVCLVRLHYNNGHGWDNAFTGKFDNLNSKYRSGQLAFANRDIDRVIAYGGIIFQSWDTDPFSFYGSSGGQHLQIRVFKYL